MLDMAPNKRNFSSKSLQNVNKSKKKKKYPT